MSVQDDDARAARDARVKQAADAKEADLKGLKERQDDQAKSNAEAMRRQNESRPTPTQEENDMARLGHHVLNKEDDGSGPDPASLSPDEQRKLRERRQSEAGSGAPYRTRAAAANPTPPAASTKPLA